MFKKMYKEISKAVKNSDTTKDVATHLSNIKAINKKVHLKDGDIVRVTGAKELGITHYEYLVIENGKFLICASQSTNWSEKHAGWIHYAYRCNGRGYEVMSSNNQIPKGVMVRQFIFGYGFVCQYRDLSYFFKTNRS